ncbi:hypothetical protein ACFQQB_02470 [Nonomuraea rubra]|uniref:hypothetical protein n=1 Tax=Nonomuraea rubra TaxID=46180 RepID=UPI00361F3BC5
MRHHGRGTQQAPPAPQQSSAAPQTQAASPAAAPPKVDEGWPRWGFTHTGVSANNVTREFEQVVAGRLARTPMLQNQHIMGFGALNPEPYPGQYFWEDLDSRMNVMRQSKATPVITLCCAPDWMKGGPEGPTADSAWAEHLEDAPYPEFFDEFAKLSATVAQRYKDVKYFMVWNEFKGFWKDHSKPADYKGYTEMYNKVYDAVKAVRPDAQIGGPYLGFDSNAGGDTELRGDWGSSTRTCSTPSTTGSRTRRAPTSSSWTAPRSPTRTSCCRTSSARWPSSPTSPSGCGRRPATCRSGGRSGTTSPRTAARTGRSPSAWPCRPPP